MKSFEYIFSSQNSFSLCEIQSDSSLAADEILVAPKFTGICGSDLYHYKTYKGHKLRLGHEWIGEIIGTGSNVSGLKTGDMITTSAALGCGECEFCKKGEVNLCQRPVFLGSEKMGSLRSELKFKAFNALKLKSKNKSEVLIEVLAVAVEALNLIEENLKEKPEKVLVMGCGTVGLLTAYLLKEKNIQVTVVDNELSRVDRGIALNLNACLLNQLLLEKPVFDVIVDATSDRDNKPGGWKYLPMFGNKKFLGIMIGKYINEVSIKPDVFGRLAAKLVFMRGVPLKTLEQTIDQWSGKLDYLAEKLITHEYKVSDVSAAFDKALETKESGKVIITMEP